MPLVIPNSIENDTPADAAEIQQNFATIQTYTNSELVNRDGSVALTAPLLLPGDPTQNNQAANKQYVDARVLRVGDAMTGPLIVETAKIAKNSDVGSPTDAMFTHKDAPGYAGFGLDSTGSPYVVAAPAKTFDVYTSAAGPVYETKLTVSSTAVTATVPVAGVAPTAATHLTRKDYVDAQDAAVTTAANTRMDAQDSAYYTSAASRMDSQDALRVAKTGDTMSGSLNVGSDPTAWQGVRLINIGGIAATIVGTGSGGSSSLTSANLNLQRAGSPASDSGGRFAIFQRSAGGVGGGPGLIGSITISGAGIAYNESSDYRLKNDLGSVVDAVDRLKALRPRHLSWKDDDSEFDGFFAHEVAEVVPNAVVGAKDALTEEGTIDAQQMDSTKLVPLLVAALQDALARIEVLEAAA